VHCLFDLTQFLCRVCIHIRTTTCVSKSLFKVCVTCACKCLFQVYMFLFSEIVSLHPDLVHTFDFRHSEYANPICSIHTPYIIYIYIYSICIYSLYIYYVYTHLHTHSPIRHSFFHLRRRTESIRKDVLLKWMSHPLAMFTVRLACLFLCPCVCLWLCPPSVGGLKLLVYAALSY